MVRIVIPKIFLYQNFNKACKTQVYSRKANTTLVVKVFLR
jgi:hypothetical protein